MQKSSSHTSQWSWVFSANVLSMGVSSHYLYFLQSQWELMTCVSISNLPTSIEWGSFAQPCRCVRPGCFWRQGQHFYAFWLLLTKCHSIFTIVITKECLQTWAESQYTCFVESYSSVWCRESPDDLGPFDRSWPVIYLHCKHNWNFDLCTLYSS